MATFELEDFAALSAFERFPFVFSRVPFLPPQVWGGRTETFGKKIYLFGGKNRDVARSLILMANDLWYLASSNCPRLPGFSISSNEVRFMPRLVHGEYSPFDFCFFCCAPRTPTGRLSSVPLTVFFSVRGWWEDRSCSGQIKFRADGTVKRYEVKYFPYARERGYDDPLAEYSVQFEGGGVLRPVLATYNLGRQGAWAYRFGAK